MALYVNTNVSSLNACRNLANATGSLDTVFKRLASGLRINSARDDAAGLQISDRLTSQINGLNQGNRNAQDGISFCQTAEGALDEMTNMYQRIRTLAIQSANGTNSAADRKAIQQEVSQLCEEITRIGNDTTFGGTHILDQSLTAPTEFQVGADANETVSIDLTSGFRVDDVFQKLYNEADSAERTSLLKAGFGTGFEVDWNGDSPAFDVELDPSAPSGEYNIRVVNQLEPTTVLKHNSSFDRTVTDSDGNQVVILAEEMTFGAGTLTFSYGSGSNAGSFTIQVDNGDTMEDIRNKCRALRRSGIIPIEWTTGHTGTSRHSQIIFNSLRGDINRPLSVTSTGDEALKAFEFNVGPDSDVHYRDYDWSIMQVGRDAVIDIDGERFSSDSGNTIYDPSRGLHITGKRVSGPYRLTVGAATPFSVETATDAQNTLAVVDKFIAVIDSKRAELGAVQNRLESAIRNQTNVSENVSAARSRIRDADFATETAAMIQKNILQQASRSILSQANQRPQIVLSLLQS